MTQAPEPPRRAPLPAQWWAVAGVCVLFLNAVLRLGARGVATIAGGLTPPQWLLLAVLTGIFVYGEGVRALQRVYVPHLMDRVRQLRHEPRRAWRVLAPLYAMSLVGAAGPRLLRAWAGVAAVIIAVLIVSSMPAPWRGIVDVAVAAALAWATAALALYARAAARHGTL